MFMKLIMNIVTLLLFSCTVSLLVVPHFHMRLCRWPVFAQGAAIPAGIQIGWRILEAKSWASVEFLMGECPTNRNFDDLNYFQGQWFVRWTNLDLTCSKLRHDSHLQGCLLRLMAKLCLKRRLAKPPRSSENPKRRWRIEVGRRRDLAPSGNVKKAMV